MTEISIFVIVNNQKIYEGFVANLSQQLNTDYELITIDNSNNQFNSARNAFNQNLYRANGKYIIFLHPDIRFNSNLALAEIMECVKALSDFGVIGVAGCPEELYKNKRIIYSNILHGKNKKKAGENIKRPVVVQTVDECMFIIENQKVRVFSDAKGWHLYAVELCLENIIKGKKNYVVPADIWHMSNGESLDYKYIIQLKRIIYLYGYHFKYINTTVKKWRTKGIRNSLYLNFYIAKQYIKGKLRAY